MDTVSNQTEIISNIEQSKPKLPKSLTTVTTFSKILAMILFITLPFLGFYLGMRYNEGIQVKTNSNNPTVTTRPSSKACTQEAKQCPDGSYVSRTGPNCEFSPCPSPIATTSTATNNQFINYLDSDYKISFDYPKEWGKPKVEKIPPSPDLYQFTGKENYILFDFGNNQFLKFAAADLIFIKDFYSTYEKEKQKMLEIYNTKKAVERVDPPNMMSGVTCQSEINYIENETGNLRGIYYYAGFAQNDPCYPDKHDWLMTAVRFTLTDGKERLINLSIYQNDPEETNYCTSDLPEKNTNYIRLSKNCTVNKKFHNQIEIYKKIIKSIKIVE